MRFQWSVPSIVLASTISLRCVRGGWRKGNDCPVWIIDYLFGNAAGMRVLASLRLVPIAE